MLTSKQRASLRGMANTLDTILYIGKEGITDNTVKEAYDALEARELIKCAVQQGCELTAREALDVRWALTCMELEDEVERLEAVLSPVLLRRAQAKLWQALYYHYDYAQPWLPQLEANLHGLKADWAKLTAYQQKQNVRSK